MSLPGPPVLKTTIIQLNKELDLDDSNYEILTRDYLGGDAGLASDGTATVLGLPSLGYQTTPKKKRRRLLVNVDQEELAKRKHETKQLHLIIEKRRRVKINREFEALKYLIPACRTSNGLSSVTNLPLIKPMNSLLNNGNKIDGMYKLTILKLLVEYILYLHHIIQQQHQMLADHDPHHEFDIEFARVPLDVNQYRNIDKEFNFSTLLNSDPDVIAEVPEPDHPDDDPTLPLPVATPQILPVFGSVNLRYTTLRRVLNPILPHTTVLPLTMTLPAIRSLLGIESTAKFALPDPALLSSLVDDAPLPKKRKFRSRPPSDVVINPRLLISDYAGDDMVEGVDGEIKEEDAGRTLLAMKKLSIGNLLN